MILSTILLDLDGCLVDFVGGVFAAFGADDARHDNVRGWDAIPDELSRALGRTVTADEMWHTIRGAPFWQHLCWLEHGRELFELVHSHDADLVIMTAPCSDPLSAAGKLQWIARELEGFEVSYSLTDHKAAHAHRNALLIDDGEHNVTAFRERGGKAFLWPAPWNAYGCRPNGAALERLRRTLAIARVA